MKFKGVYSADTSYNLGDVVSYEDAGYRLVNPAPAGTNPKDNRYWMRLDQRIWEVIAMILDSQAEAVASATAIINSRITEDAIALKGAGDEPKEYLITVDESGEDPDLTVTEVTEEAGS